MTTLRVATPRMPKFWFFRRPKSWAIPPITPGLFLILVRSLDGAILLLAGVLANKACHQVGNLLGIPSPVKSSAFVVLVSVCTAIFVVNRTGAYTQNLLGSTRLRLRAMLAGVAVGGLAGMFFYAAIVSFGPGIGIWAVIWMTVTGVLSTIGVAFNTYFLRLLPGTEHLATRVVVVGNNAFSQNFIGRMITGAIPTTIFVGLYSDGWKTNNHKVSNLEISNSEKLNIPVLGQLDDLIARARVDRIDAVVLATPEANIGHIAMLRAALRCMTADIFLANEAIDLICPDGRIDRLGPNAVVKIACRPLTESQIMQKAALDWILGGLTFVVLLPLSFMIGVAVCLDSPGPALFRQRRRGYNNNTFTMFKFRTMYTNMSDANADKQTTRDDPRITRIGRFLRRTSLDELPQILNVLRGEMSLVGPRPHAINTKADGRLFPDAVADYTLRYRMKPGITGWAQVNGWRGETSTVAQIEGRVMRDLYYIDNWSFLLDLKILALSIRELNSKAAF